MAISRAQQPQQIQSGIGSLQDPRQGYFLGKLVKKATRGIKKIVKSPIGKLALLGAGAYGLGALGGAGQGGFLKQLMAGRSNFGLGNIMKGAGKLFMGTDGGVFGGGGGLLGKGGTFDPKRAFLTAGAAATALPFFMGGEDEEEETVDVMDPRYQVQRAKNYYSGAGDAAQKGPGRYFDYGQVNEKGEPVFYKDYTLQPEKELPSWMKAGLAILPGGRFLTGAIENRMNPGMDGMTAAEIDENYGTGEGGGRYGIAGLSNTQKQYYDALASQGFLYDGPGGMKTLDGKNFSRITEDTINDYFQGIKDKGFATIEEYEDYLDEDPTRRKNLKLVLNQYRTLKNVNDRNVQRQEDKFNNAFDATSPPNNDPNQDHDNDGVPNNVEAAGGSYDGGYHGAEGGLENTGSGGGWSPGSGSQGSTQTGDSDFADYSQGGRVYLNLGGLASIL